MISMRLIVLVAILPKNKILPRPKIIMIIGNSYVFMNKNNDMLKIKTQNFNTCCIEYNEENCKTILLLDLKLVYSIQHNLD